MTRYWSLPGGITAKDEPAEPIGWNVFWYCAHCGDRYAQAWSVDGSLPWKALGGCCPACSGSRWAIPGSLENIMFVGWQVPHVVVQYQFERELDFTRSEDHPWNRKEEQ